MSSHLAPLASLVDRKAWWNIIKFLFAPLVAAGVTVWLLASYRPNSVAHATMLEVNLTILYLASGVLTGFYIYMWRAAVKTRSDWALIAFLGAVNGALIAVAGLITNVLLSV